MLPGGVDTSRPARDASAFSAAWLGSPLAMTEAMTPSAPTATSASSRISIPSAVGAWTKVPAIVLP